MPKQSFPYLPFPIAPSEVHPQGKTVLRPVAAATITASNGRSVRWIVLPDSGADACMFPLSLAIMLQLDVLNLPKTTTTGVGSQANVTYYDTLRIDLGDGLVFDAYAGFSQGLEAVGMGLLGQDGFFSAFHIEFRHSERAFTVQTAT